MRFLSFLHKQKKTERDRERAEQDCTSLGNILLKAGMISAEQLHEAVDYQDTNPDVMLGEALVKMGVVERDIVEALLMTQKARRDNGKHAAEVIAFAAQHTRRTVHKAHDDLNDLVTELNGKVCMKGKA